MPVFDFQRRKVSGAPIWETGMGVGAFVVAGVVVGVLMAGGLVGGLMGWLMGRGWAWNGVPNEHREWVTKTVSKSLGAEWRRRVRNVLMLGMGGGVGRERDGGRPPR